MDTYDVRFLVVLLTPTILGAIIGKAKNRLAVGVLLTLFLHVIGLLILLCVPAKKRQRKGDPSVKANNLKTWISTISLVGLGFTLALSASSAWLIGLGVMMLVAAYIVFAAASDSLCEDCGNYWAMYPVSKKLLHEKKEAYEDVATHTHYNREGRITGFTDVPVEKVATVKTYLHTHRCKFCGYQANKRSLETDKK